MPTRTSEAQGMIYNLHKCKQNLNDDDDKDISNLLYFK